MDELNPTSGRWAKMRTANFMSWRTESTPSPIRAVRFSNLCRNRTIMNRIAIAALLAATLSATTVNAGAAESLKDVFKDRFLIGTAVNRSMVTGTTFRRSAEQSAKDIEL